SLRVDARFLVCGCSIAFIELMERKRRIDNGFDDPLLPEMAGRGAGVHGIPVGHDVRTGRIAEPLVLGAVLTGWEPLNRSICAIDGLFSCPKVFFGRFLRTSIQEDQFPTCI